MDRNPRITKSIFFPEIFPGVNKSGFFSPLWRLFWKRFSVDRLAKPEKKDSFSNLSGLVWAGLKAY